MDARLRFASLGLMGLSLLAATGCQSFDLTKRIPWGAGKDGEFTRPMKLIAVWQPTVLHTTGAPPVRGFGGQVWFYGGDEEKPVTVDGTLEVYAFDETNRPAENTVPDRKYVFTPEDVQKHHSERSLGDAYSFWLPWGDVNGPPVEISLIARFTPVDGSGTIVGEQTHHLLPGRELPKHAKRPKSRAATLSALPARSSSYLPMDAARASGPAASPPVVPGHPGGVELTGHTAEIPGAANQEGDPPTPLHKPGMRVTTLSVPNRAGGGAPFTTSGVAYPFGGTLPASEASPSRAAANQPAGSIQATAPQQPPATGYRPGQRRVLGGPIGRLTRENDPWRPNPARWQYGRGLAPQSAPQLAPSGNAAPVGSTAR